MRQPLQKLKQIVKKVNVKYVYPIEIKSFDLSRYGCYLCDKFIVTDLKKKNKISKLPEYPVIV